MSDLLCGACRLSSLNDELTYVRRKGNGKSYFTPDVKKLEGLSAAGVLQDSDRLVERLVGVAWVARKQICLGNAQRVRQRF